MLPLPANLPKTLIVGANSYIGKKFFEVYPSAIGTARIPSNRIYHLELSEPDNITVHLDAIPLQGIHQALLLAYHSKIAHCEHDPTTRNVNVQGMIVLLEELAKRGIKPIFFSSDSIFDGKTGYYEDSALPNPIIEYGRHKAEIERRIPEITRGNYLTVRLSKIFSLEKGDGTLLDEMAHQFSQGETVQAAYDNIICPTLREDVVRAVACLQTKGTTGTLNLCSPEKWSRYGLALELAKEMNIDQHLIHPVSIDDLADGFIRPKNISMNTTRLQQEIDFTFTPLIECIRTIARLYRN